MKKIFLIATGVFICHTFLFAQQVNLLEETTKMRNAYRQQPYLSYNVKYTISPVSRPQENIDTLAGTMKIYGNKYWGTLNETEFMQNEEYLISAYNNYRMLKVDTPSALYPALPNLRFIDSLIGKDNYILSATNLGEDKMLLFVFKENKFAFKTFSIMYDARTYFLMQFSYTMATEDDNNQFQKEVDKEDRLVKVSFTDYTIHPFDTTVFNTQNYFNRAGAELSPAGKFADYQLNIGSPNVIK